MKNEIPRGLASFDDEEDLLGQCAVTVSVLVVVIGVLVGIGVGIGYLIWG